MKREFVVSGISVRVVRVEADDYICLTDMLKAKDGEFFITDWLRNRNTLEYIGIWEKINNPEFNYGEFATIRNQAGLNSSVTNLVISDGAVNIARAAFSGCTMLHNVSIPLSVTSIGTSAFRDCSGLTRVMIPECVTNIGESAFSNCRGLTSVAIPNGVTSIGNYTFSSCGSLTSVTIPESVTSIGEDAFWCCSGLTSVKIPESVNSIGFGAFEGCYGLKDVFFEGDIVASIAANAFENCNWDMVVHVPDSWKGRSSTMFGYSIVREGAAEATTVNLTITNVVVQYVLNSVQSGIAVPVSADTGFVTVITEVKSSGAVSVPSEWKENYPTFAEKYGSDFGKALTMKSGKKDGAGNDMIVWQDYVAGTDPTDENSKFTASVTMVGGKPVVSYSPELSAAEAAKRVYTTWGKAKLQDAEWVEVPAGREADYNFFKVSVEMK